MASGSIIKSIPRQVKPLLSLDKQDAKRRVLNLYKAWYRQIPIIVLRYDIYKTDAQMKAKLREKFEKNRDVKDIRVIDMLVIKGQMELQETAKLWKPKHSFMDYFRESPQDKPKDFLSKFLDGHNV